MQIPVVEKKSSSTTKRSREQDLEIVMPRARARALNPNRWCVGPLDNIVNSISTFRLYAYDDEINWF